MIIKTESICNSN